MLKYTTAVNNDDGIVSPTHHKEIEYMPNTLKVSAGSKSNSKMAIRKREGLRRIIKREQDIRDMRNGMETPHLPPISQSGTPQGFVPPSSLVPERKESFYPNQPMKRKEIKTPYISHMPNRVTEVTTPYVMHTHLSSIEQNNEANILRENSKLSGGNIIEIRREPELRHEATFSSLQKLPTSSSPINDKRPRGRHGRHKNSSFNEHDYNRNNDLKDLTIQSNQIGLSRRTERRPREVSRGKGDEAFSIRKKIEQFRKWHEEQYRDKIKKLKQEVDHQFEAEHTKVIRNVPAVRDTPTSKNDVSMRGEMEKTSVVSHEKMEQEEKATPILSNETSKARTSSARTWRTWRNVNDSYAYNDVRKYIEENELMDEEKADWIKKWVIEVNRAMKDVVHESVL